MVGRTFSFSVQSIADHRLTFWPLRCISFLIAASEFSNVYLLWLTAPGYPFGIFKHLLHLGFVLPNSNLSISILKPSPHCWVNTDMASSDANWFILKAYSRSNWFYFKRCQYSMFYTNCSWIFCIIWYVNSIERMKYVAFWFSCIHKEFNVDPYNIHIFRDLQSEPIR